MLLFYDVNEPEVDNQVPPDPGTAGNIVGLLLLKYAIIPMLYS